MKIKLLIIVLFCSMFSRGQIYQHDFSTNASTVAGTPYTVTPNILFPNLSASSWTCPFAFTNSAGSAGNSLSVALGAGATSATYTLTLNVASGFQLSIANFSFWTRRSGSGPTNWSMTINGSAAGTGTNSTAGANTSSLIPTIPANNLTGLVTIVLALTSGSPLGTFRLDDFIMNGTVTSTCTPTTITSVFPLSGSQNTEVTINAASGLLGATATFNGIAATTVSSSATQLIVQIPSGATTGNLVVTNSTSCASTGIPFTVFTNDLTSCQGSFPATTDLIIYEVHDEFSASGGTVTLYNGTAASINLSNYKIYRRGTYGSGAPAVNYATLTGSIASGALGYIQVLGSNSCTTPASTNGTITGGFNDNDEISLRNASGSLPAIDEVQTSVVGPGFYMVRNLGFYANRSTFVPADWSTTALAAGVCDPRLGTALTVTSTVPIINTQPTVSITCASTSVTLAVTATEGFIGGNTLAYNWFAVAPSTTSWIDLVTSPLAGHTGANTASLVISPLLDGYQYYCQVRENTATCFVASVAVKVSTGTTTWNGALPWTNGTPTLTKAAIINGTYNTGTNGSFDACNVTVNSLKSLTISGGTYVNIQNGLTVNGTVLVQNNGSLVQINDLAVNSGNITVERTAVVDAQDYVYWSAPVSGQSLATQFGTTPASLKWRWDATAINANGTEGNWLAHNAGMADGVGYIVGNTTTATFTKSFTGNTHNGVYTPQIKRGSVLTVRKDNWNLLGNPYPSAISVNKFLDTNTILEGYVNVWTHGQAPINTVSPFYQNFVTNYFSNDYITVNSTGNNNNATDFEIASGQGFMVPMDDGSSFTTTATFNNSMRNKGYDNTQFYRTSQGNTNRNRIWLDLNSDSERSRTMFGYLTNATNDFDKRYDAYTNVGSGLKLFSVLNNDRFGIQGKALPFADTDLVSLGINIPITGNYTISIAEADGLFSNNAQTIYLEDKLLHVIHNLSTNPYAFSANPGTVSDRFLIRYTNTALSTSNFEAVANQVFVFGTNNGITIDSKITSIKSYVVYNVLGQVIASANNINKNISEITSLQKNNQALVVKATLDNDQVITKKIIF